MVAASGDTDDDSYGELEQNTLDQSQAASGRTELDLDIHNQSFPYDEVNNRGRFYTSNDSLDYDSHGRGDQVAEHSEVHGMGVSTDKTIQQTVEVTDQTPMVRPALNNSQVDRDNGAYGFTREVDTNKSSDDKLNYVWKIRGFNTCSHPCGPGKHTHILHSVFY